MLKFIFKFEVDLTKLKSSLLKFALKQRFETCGNVANVIPRDIIV